APGELGAGQRDVLQALVDERAGLVVAGARGDEVGAAVEQVLERLLELGKAEEPVLLVLPLERDAVDRAGVVGPDLGTRLEVGAAGAVPALVQALVDVAV